MAEEQQNTEQPPEQGVPEDSGNLPTEIDPAEELSQAPDAVFESSPDAVLEVERLEGDE